MAKGEGWGRGQRISKFALRHKWMNPKRWQNNLWKRSYNFLSGCVLFIFSFGSNFVDIISFAWLLWWEKYSNLQVPPIPFIPYAILFFFLFLHLLMWVCLKIFDLLPSAYINFLFHCFCSDFILCLCLCLCLCLFLTFLY